MIQNLLLKNLPISIQAKTIDIYGYYFPNIVGLIKGYDELGFYVNGTNVECDKVRHIEIQDTAKWFYCF